MNVKHGFARLLPVGLIAGAVAGVASRFGFGGLKKPEDAEHPHPKPVLEDY